MSNPPFTSPFTPDPNASAPSPDSPFAPSMSQGDLGEGFELPPCPVGVLRGHTTELASYPKGLMLRVVCDDPSYPSKEPIGVWIGKDTAMLLQIATSLGLTVTRTAGRFFISDDEGRKDAEAFKNKPGVFVFAPRDGGPSINAFGLPQKGKSPEWDQWVEESGGLSDEQVKALKRARGGVVPGDSINLFI